ncbi:MAG: hypothetical protein Q8L86_12435 [Vicinamibacterales bacterium]|nr:hypothetical protein [Vicinamibacterales bacterium]
MDKEKYKPVGGEMTDRNWPEKGQSLVEGQVIEGIYVAVNRNVGANKSNVYVLETAEGDKVGVWGNTVLDTKFEQIELNSKVGIEYLGSKTSKKSGKPYHDFFVGIEAPVTDNEPPF